MRNNRKFSIFEIIVILAILALLAAVVIPGLLTKANAQPYYTNTVGLAPGVQTYNLNFPTPLNPAATIASQYASGTLAGSIQGGAIISTVNYYTNTFTTNIYTAAPFVVVSSSATNIVPAVISVSTTNFVVQVVNTNCTLYWEATGH